MSAHSSYRSHLDEPNPAEGAFASIPFHPHNLIRSHYFNEKKQIHEILHEANDLDPVHHQQPADAVLVNLGDWFSKGAVAEKRLKALSIETQSHEKQIDRDPENVDAKVASPLKQTEKIVMEHLDRISIDTSLMQVIQSIYDDTHLEISPEEIISHRYKSLNKLLMTAQSLSNTAMDFSVPVDQSEQLRSDILNVLDQLWHFVDYGNTLMSKKIKRACRTLKFCLEHTESCNSQSNNEQMRCDEEVCGITGGYFSNKPLKNDHCTVHCKIGLITMKILQLQRRARHEINNVVSNLYKQTAVCRYQLDALEMETNDPNTFEMWQDAINLCKSNLQQLGLTAAASPFNSPD